MIGFEFKAHATDGEVDIPRHYLAWRESRLLRLYTEYSTLTKFKAKAVRENHLPLAELYIGLPARGGVRLGTGDVSHERVVTNKAPPYHDPYIRPI